MWITIHTKSPSRLASYGRQYRVLTSFWPSYWFAYSSSMFMSNFHKLTSAKISSDQNMYMWWISLLQPQNKANCPSNHQWLRQISMKLPFVVLRKSALKFTIGSKRENLISYHFLLFWFNQNSISVLKTLLSCLSEKSLWKVDSESLYIKQGCMKSR